LVSLFLLLDPANILFLYSYPTRRSSDLFHIVIKTAVTIGIAIDYNLCLRNFADLSFQFAQGFFSRFTEKEFIGIKKDLGIQTQLDRKSTRLNSSHVSISYAVFCLKKKKY